ncbi:hypothetical protein EJ05DRAFT_468773 [Pseudovirgaria hyperparasitica]|uniref:NAD(P)-binding protein n=1 Tax=Pseudovirgaria hyperparasitica TaxID=470096 RepID=A0A6A6VXE6_9PEZI|nr:uncharacterized protein EJ05DRAFT_468773 [Pseudovirgaria hyperparasitica]KAF2754374.1 hypothetical protein EJ05DRAFT_468773 [Pseudovirgaria hyperparasitica]
MSPQPPAVDILILGTSWTTTFLTPLLRAHNITHATTSTTARPGTLPFHFVPSTPSTDQDDDEVGSQAQYTALPPATLILITFPLTTASHTTQLTRHYTATHPSATPYFVLLGSTRIFTPTPSSPLSYDASSPRAVAEDTLLALYPSRATVLNLAGLYGQSSRHSARDPRSWLSRVAPGKEALGRKGALHLVHGGDVARGVLGGAKEQIWGRRWIVTDLHWYDWWELAFAWGDGRLDHGADAGKDGDGEYREWVMQLMEEHGVRALPRPVEVVGRVLDSRAFWRAVGMVPGRGHVLSVVGGEEDW